MKKIIVTFTVLFAFPVTNIWAADCGFVCDVAGGTGQGNALTCKNSSNVCKCTVEDGTTFACVTNAEIIGTGAAAACTCKDNFYANSDSYTACDTANGFISTAGSNDDINGCKKTCQDILVTNGHSPQAPINSEISQGNSCEYEVECNPGYRDSGTQTNITSYTCDPNTYSIDYEGGGNTGGAQPPSPTSCTYDQDCAAPANTYAKTGSTFNGWKCTGGLSGKCDGNIIAAGGSLKNVSTGAAITLTATWNLCSNYDASKVKTISGANCTITECFAGYYIPSGTTGTATRCDASESKFYCANGKTRTDCGNGYYCPGGFPNKPSDCSTPVSFNGGNYIGLCTCPPGKTSPASSAYESDCHYVNGVTLFCDGSGNNCFTLPAIKTRQRRVFIVYNLSSVVPVALFIHFSTSA